MVFTFKKDKELKNKYLNKTINKKFGNVIISFQVHKVNNGWLYCYSGKNEIRFRPYEIFLS